MKKIISVILAVLIIAVLTLPSFATGQDYVEFGQYPQRIVEDSSVISSLEAVSLEWKENSYMKYADTELNGQKYRAVIFTKVRTKNADGTGASYQSRNGYDTGRTYWFAYTPVLWRILDRESGLCMSENILDSQPFNNEIFEKNGVCYSDESCIGYAHDYKYSSLRKWLNEDFADVSFSDSEKLLLTERECQLYSFPSSKEKVSDSAADKVFLLNRLEASNEAYGFSNWISVSDYARRARGTDYAKSQGIRVFNGLLSGYTDNSMWWMSAPGYATNQVNKVYFDGYCSGDSYRNVTYTHIGVRPCICLKLSELPQSSFVSYDNPIPESTIATSVMWKAIMSVVRVFGPIKAWFI